MILRALTVAAALLAGGSAAAQQTETITFPGNQKGKTVEVPATVYWPAGPGPFPALVIHHGSGGVTSAREGRYAREMAAMGVAGVVIDSFKPRGVTSTVQDQTAVTGPDFNADALGVLKALGRSPRIDRARIGIIGFSKGGTSALMATHMQQVEAAGVPPGLRYALHVPFYPSCSIQFYRPRTTGAPIYMLLGGSDSYVGVEPCQTYADMLRTGGALVDVKVYPNAMHGFDGGAAWFDPRGENYSACVSQQQADGSWIERKSGVTTTGSDGRSIPGAASRAVSICRTLGVSGGGNDAATRDSMADLKAYVRRHLIGS
jgi:dienelactone hydrolase